MIKQLLKFSLAFVGVARKRMRGLTNKRVRRKENPSLFSKNEVVAQGRDDRGDF